MSARRGNAIELRAQRLLEECGYLVHRAVRSSRPGRAQSNDVWGAFDLLATQPGRRLLLVQVTTASNVAARRRKVEAVAEWFEPDHAQVEVWGWNVKPGKSGEWRVWRWLGEWKRREAPCAG